MIFNTFSYFVCFLIPASIVFRLSAPRIKPWVLIASGAAFYIWFSLTAVGGILGAWCISLFLWESATARLYRPKSHWCHWGVLQALLVLIAFKYWNFVCGLVGGTESPWRWTSAFLPLGISFFTFEFIHFAVDRRKGKVEAGTFEEYLAFILFFPTMVAGPIKRFQDFLVSLRCPSQEWPQDFERGTTRILCGLAKKFAIADLLTSMTAHLNGEDIRIADRWVLVVWLIAYSLKIYFDFSSYSDIAIGSSRLFGLKVKENFDWPYLCTNLSDFWRHWHMSLSSWLNDYVFIPLGGSRGCASRTFENLMITMLISGLWHGAGLNFAVWGLWHGCGLVVHRWWRRVSAPSAASLPYTYGAWLMTFAFVTIGWTFFVMDLPTAVVFLKRMFLGDVV